ncbi:MAG: DUF1292 domain-containing protein [Gudongella sp.]|nr:DUF1292 domain-containing protein [Gudongella sp.]
MPEKHIFYDELGNEIEFVVKAKFNFDDQEYVALLPSKEIDALTYILKIEMNDDGEEVLVHVDDEELEEAKDIYEEIIKNHLQ